LSLKTTTHRRDAENAEEAQRKAFNSLRELCLLCVSAVKFFVLDITSDEMKKI
jgi:hypothetical protein